MAEAAVLQARDQLGLVQRQLHAGQPAAQQGACVLGAEVAGALAVAQVALAHHPLDDPQHRRGVGPVRRAWPPPRLRMASAIAACVHFGAEP